MEMDVAFRSFKAEVKALPEDEQEARWAEILAEDDESSDGDIRPPKALRTPTAVMKAARKQFTELVSITRWLRSCVCIDLVPRRLPTALWKACTFLALSYTRAMTIRCMLHPVFLEVRKLF